MALPVSSLQEATAFSKDGAKLGSVSEVFVDDKSGDATFVAVNHGLFGRGTSIVPLDKAVLRGEELTLAFAKDTIKDAPEFAEDEPLGPSQQEKVLNYFGVKRAASGELDF